MIPISFFSHRETTSLCSSISPTAHRRTCDSCKEPLASYWFERVCEPCWVSSVDRIACDICTIKGCDECTFRRCAKSTCHVKFCETCDKNDEHRQRKLACKHVGTCYNAREEAVGKDVGDLSDRYCYECVQEERWRREDEAEKCDLVSVKILLGKSRVDDIRSRSLRADLFAWLSDPEKKAPIWAFKFGTSKGEKHAEMKALQHDREHMPKWLEVVKGYNLCNRLVSWHHLSYSF